MLRFTLLTILLSTIILLSVLGGVRSGLFPMPSFTTRIIILLAIVHVALYYFTARNRSLNPLDFVKLYLGMTVLRILFFSAFIFVIIKLDPIGAWQNATLFLTGYILFTALEAVVTYKKIVSEKPSKFDQKDL